MVGEPWWQEVETADHVVSTVRKQSAVSSHFVLNFVPFMKSRTQAKGMVTPMIRVRLPTSVDQVIGMPGGIFISFIAPRIPCIVRVIPDPVKLIISITNAPTI